MTSDRDRPFTIGFNGSRAFTLNDDDRDAIEFNEKNVGIRLEVQLKGWRQ